jgi:hypothetical protein
VNKAFGHLPQMGFLVVVQKVQEFYPVIPFVIIRFKASRIQSASATPAHLAKTSAGVLKPKHFSGIALILLTTLSIFFCVINRQSYFFRKISSQYPAAVFYAPFFPTVVGFTEI